MATNPLTASPWTEAEVNSWTTRFGFSRTNGAGSVRVTQLYVEVDYTEAACGDNILQVVVGEACDDGNVNNNDGCSSTCTIEVCGDGITQNNETCDDGNLNNNDGCSSTCAIEVCGDGIINGSEACDDGNLNNADGCDSSCAIEDGFTCAGETLSVCAQCPAGTSSIDGAACAPCVAGTYSEAGAASCTVCAEGTYSEAGATTCNACSAGYQPNGEQTGCDVCPVGTSSENGNACAPCEGNTIAENEGTATCVVCPE